MTPSEKAKDLVHTFYYKLPNNGYLNEGINSASSRYNEAIMCALVTINHITVALNSITDHYVELGMRTFWQEVEQEINKLYDNRDTTKNPIGNG
jgi:hypothetical protein